MSTAKKRKVSGLSGLELEMSLTLLRNLRTTLNSEDGGPTPSDQLDQVIALLESRTNDPLVRP